MSCFLCFICHNTVQTDTNVETREKYRDLVGMKLCPDSHLCHICCHLLRKLWLFKSICLRRSMEYPVLFSDRGTVNLQNTQIENVILCPDIAECDQISNNTYHFTEYENTNQYVSLEDKAETKLDIVEEKDQNYESDIDHTNDLDLNEYEQDIEKQIDEITTDKKDETIELETKELDTNNDFYKIVLSVEEQKAELEARRREDKYLEAEFKCYNCAISFLFKDTYQAHMMRHEESNGEHLCPICLLRFASGAVLRAHAHGHRERCVCARCGARVPPRRRHAHTAKCANTTQAICHLCSKSFNDGNALQQHIKRFHLSKTSSRTYSCHVCGRTYNNQAAVRTHMINEHNKEDAEMPAAPASSNDTTITTPSAAVAESNALDDIASKHVNKKFPCTQCPARFSSPYSLTAHSKNHCQSTKTYQCEPCRRIYNSQKSLTAHLRNAPCHQSQVLSCQICSKTCATPRSLSSHMLTVHSSIKKHSCGLCGAIYSSRKSLGAHLRKHTGQPKVCLCHLCGASFQGNSKLKRHLRSVCEKNKLEEELSAFYNQE